MAANATAPSKPRIFINPTCPFAHKAWLALLEKEVDCDFEWEDLANKSPDMQAAYKGAAPNPESAATVPIFVHEGRTMIESALVAKYVAAAFEGGNDILPATPSEEYAGALFAETFNAVTPNYFKALRATSQEELDAALNGVRASLRAAERALELAATSGGGGEGAGGPYAAGGDRYTVADIITSTMAGLRGIVASYRSPASLPPESESHPIHSNQIKSSQVDPDV